LCFFEKSCLYQAFCSVTIANPTKIRFLFGLSYYWFWSRKWSRKWSKFFESRILPLNVPVRSFFSLHLDSPQTPFKC
jgi:hypothetical protein